MHFNIATTFLTFTLTVATPAINLAQRASPTTTCTAVSATPSPKNTLCGVYGELLRPSEIGFGDSGGYPDGCAIQCLQMPDCVSFTFEAHETYCGFFNKTVKHQAYKKLNTTDLSIWNRKCWTQECL